MRREQTTLLHSFKGIFRYAPGGEQIALPSRAAVRYTPNEGVSFTPPENRRLNRAATVPTRQQQGSTTGRRAQVTLLDATNNHWWILFGVRGSRRTLQPTQIQVTDLTTDSHIFRQLKKIYRTHRGWLRLWLSVWRLDYCEVVKVCNQPNATPQSHY